MKCVIILAVAVVSCCLASKCDICSNPDFMGFGFEPSEKCGCCPWPCCCKCVGADGGGPPEPCRAFLDMAFVMDASGSIGEQDWQVAKQFFGDVVSELAEIGKGQRVAAITFASNASVQWRLNDDESSSMAKLQTAIKGLENIGTFTNIAEALELADKDIFSKANDNAAPNIAVLMTDGRSNFLVDEVAGIAENLRKKARTVCIGVTNQIDKDELRSICAESDIFNVNDFDALANILADVQNKICPTKPMKEKCFCCCTPEMFWGAGGAKYYGAGRW